MKPVFNWEIPQYFFDPSNPFEFQVNNEWLALRADRLTASNASALLADGKNKDGLGKEIISILNKRAMERLCGWIDDTSVAWKDKEAVLRGVRHESEALSWYGSRTSQNISVCGFVERGRYLGCSPDGLIPEIKKMVQIKIPMPQNFINAIMNWKEYKKQVEMEIFVCDYEVSDLVIYSPELRAGKIIPINRNPETDKKIMDKMSLAVRYRNKILKEVGELLC